MKFLCLFGHDWIEGRMSSPQTRKHIKSKAKPTTNRQCFRCGKREMRADEDEKEHAARVKMREGLDTAHGIDS
ncbi:hypothetical protein LCGC14_1474290 [marine sediment metagenome]|uniref:Uncharacterized protein n=1 Tax=marine sediment metagenome TaxID=412755 RepID=A0A0F9JXD1_9ZZZZ